MLCIVLALLHPPPRHASAQIDSTAGDAWLPLPVEEIESPERLDEPAPFGFGLDVDAAVRGDSLARVRVGAAVESGGRRLRASIVTDPGSKRRATTGSFRDDALGLDLTAGRVAIRETGSLVAEAMGLVPRAGRVPVAAAVWSAFEAPAGLSSPAIEGAGARRLSRPGGVLCGPWLLAGRIARKDGNRVLGAGGAIAAGELTIGAAAGLSGEALVGGASLERRSRDGSIATEVAWGPRRGAVLLSVETRGPLDLRGRWRYRAADRDPVASELSVASGPRRARARLRISGGPSGSTGRAERIEVEARLAPGGTGPLALRIGRANVSGFSSSTGFTARWERFLVLDWSLVRSSGRGVSLLATRRERGDGSSRRLGSSLGGRLDLTWPGRASLELRVEAVRADRGGGAAWSGVLYAGGATALQSRTRPGVQGSARGCLRLGKGWRVGGVLEEREDDGGRRATAASIWIQRAIPPASTRGGGRPSTFDER